MDNKNRIIFEKVNLPKLVKEYTVVDMHMHTKHSDGINKLSAIIKKAKKLGIGVAITDHNKIKGAVEAENYKGILIIPGIEVTPKEGTHMLIYFYDVEDLKEFYKDSVKPYKGPDTMSPLSLHLEELIDRARKYKTLIILAHPYSTAFTGICNHHFLKKNLDKIFRKVDGVEVINSENLHKWNAKSAFFGFNLDKSVTAGSDGHTLYHMTKAITYSDCKPDRKSFLDAVKKKNNKVIGKEIDMLRKITSQSFKLKTNLRNYPDIIEKNIRYNYNILSSKRKTLTDNVKILNMKVITRLKNGNNKEK